MRVLLVAVILTITCGIAEAGGPPPHCPTADNPMFAMQRFCMLAAEEASQSRKLCMYDCLINRDSITIAAEQSCPITVKQMLFTSGRSELVMR